MWLTLSGHILSLREVRAGSWHEDHGGMLLTRLVSGTLSLL